MKIQKVRSWDVLNIRSQSDSESKKLIGIPYKESCVINYGCGKNIDLEAMLDMEEEAVKAFLAQAQDDWCYVEYKGIRGWASKYYLTESTSACTK
ncbi:hypothetical protein JHD50_00755 [Sulfurimonas sp. MAG313]|nr:hypothetical protein [Sulfurimonas sp. MAG313]MDF1879842.1 hypothetical protein [Sulfurimonas sp. MAG313]